MATLQSRYESASAQYQEIQRTLTLVGSSRQKLDTQLQENKLVQEEFGKLKEEAVIYKLIGPALVKQDKAEAVSNVEKRLEFINAEIKRVDASLKATSQQSEIKKMEIIGLQQEMAPAAASG